MGYGFIAIEGFQDVFVHLSAITGDGYRRTHYSAASRANISGGRAGKRRTVRSLPVESEGRR